MCILLKLHYAKFDVSGLFGSKAMEEKPLGWVGPTPPPPPLVKEELRVKQFEIFFLGCAAQHAQ